MTPEFFLGPLGHLRALPCPKTGLVRTVERFGGLHQGLSGHRTMDVMGFRASYSLEFTFLDPDEIRWLDALHQRVHPGPFYMIDPMRANRLSRQAALVDTTTPFIDNTGGFFTALLDDYPSEVNLPVRTVRWYAAESGDEVTFDADRRVPVLPGETVTFSLYLKGSGNFELHLGGQSTPVLLNGDWQRVSVAVTVGSETSLSGRLVAAGGTQCLLACAQIEASASPTEWNLGGAAPMVLLDQLETTSPRFPYSDFTVTILEV